MPRRTRIAGGGEKRFTSAMVAAARRAGEFETGRDRARPSARVVRSADASRANQARLAFRIAVSPRLRARAPRFRGDPRGLRLAKGSAAAGPRRSTSKGSPHVTHRQRTRRFRIALLRLRCRRLRGRAHECDGHDCNRCPAGYINDGCTCRIDAYIYAQPSYGRGAGTTPTCTTH
jgi:hypothetical protein